MNIELNNEQLTNAIGVRERLHEHPEPSGNEKWILEFVAAECRRLGLTLMPSSTGIIAKLGNGGATYAIALHADIDAVRLEYPLKRPYGGAIHCGGHDWHTAALLLAAELMTKANAVLQDIYFVFQPQSESMMGADKLARELSDIIDKPILGVFSVHNRPDIELGGVAAQSGTVVMGNLRFGITLSQGVASLGNPIHAAAELIKYSNSCPWDNSAYCISFSSINGGMEGCRYPQSVEITGSINATSESIADEAYAMLGAAMKNTADRNGCRAVIRRYSSVPPIINDERLELLARDAAVTALDATRRYRPSDIIGKEGVIVAKPSIEMDDFGVYARLAPVFCFGVGCKKAESGSELYARRFEIDKGFLPIASTIFYAVAIAAAEHESRC